MSTLRLSALDWLVSEQHLVVYLLSIGAVLSIPLAAVGYRRSQPFLKLSSAVIIALFVGFIGSVHSPSSEVSSIQWEKTTEVALQSAKLTERIVMVDLYADWCAACKKLDSETFSDSRVAQKLSKSLVPARLDFTQENENTERLSERYDVVGLPCILFLRQDGTEIPNSRISGFLGPQAFLNHLASLEL